MSENEGRQSPSHEESSSRQKDAPSSGTGVNEGTKNKEESKGDLDALESNPKPILEDHRKEQLKKTEDPLASDKLK